MKKKIIILITSVLIILLILYFMLFHKSTNDVSTLFIINNIEDVYKIYISNNDDSVSIEKKKINKWSVNNKYPASEESIKKLIQTLTEVKIHKPVTKEKNDSVLKALNEKGINIKVYSKKNKILKEWFIGQYKNSENGTYIKEKNHESPYIVNIPGLEKDLNYRYNTNLLYWIDHEIFSYEPREIQEIEITDNIESKHSFLLKIDNEDVYLYLNEKEKEITSINKNKVGSYLSYFLDIKFSSFPGKEIKDSVIKTNADYIIKIKDIYNSEKKVNLFKIKIGNNTFDPFKLYALINDEDLVIVNYTDIDLIIKNPDYFINP